MICLGRVYTWRGRGYLAFLPASKLEAMARRLLLIPGRLSSWLDVATLMILWYGILSFHEAQIGLTARIPLFLSTGYQILLMLNTSNEKLHSV